MKTKILFLSLFLAYAGVANAQITLEHVYSTDPPDRYVKLSSGLKYVSLHEMPSIPGYTFTYFNLYNPDHSLFKTINIPQIPGKCVYWISYISDTLFDTDTLVEYLAGFNSTSFPYNAGVRVYNENGVILLDRDTATFSPYREILDIGMGGQTIFPNGTNSKLMILKGPMTGTHYPVTEIYNLPGQLSCLECSNGVVSGLTQQPSSSQSNKSIAYPNPFTNGVKIKYILPENCKHASINIYDFTGKLIKKKEIDNHFNEVYISNDEIKQGAYFYQVVADDKVISGNKMIKI